jgi:hypothetical protein
MLAYALIITVINFLVTLLYFSELFNFLVKISLIRKYYFGLGNVRVYAAAVAAAANSDLFV